MNKIRWAALGVFLVGIFGGVSNVFADSTLLTVNISHVSLELDVPSSPVVLNLNPTFSGSSFGSVDLTAIVGTNNPSGYHLSVDFSDTALAHIGEVSGTTPTINTLDTLAGGYTEDAFTVNRWGHKITGNNYFPIPSSTLSPESWTSDGPVNNAGNTMTLAAKVDTSTPSGAYEVTLNYTLVANIVEIYTSFDDAYADAGKSKDVTSDKYQLHEMTPAICSAVTTGQTGQLVDIRDGTVYNVGKLEDERCWLLDNLALDVVSPTVQANMSPSNTNATQAAIMNYINGGNLEGNPGWTTEAVSYETTSANMYHQPRINIDSKDNTRATLTYTQDSLEAANDWKFGVYYNYCAASIGIYCYTHDGGVNAEEGVDRNESSAIDADQDICPAGWRMPTGGAISSTGTTTGGGEYQILYDKYNDPTTFRTALHLSLPGYFYNGSSTGLGATYIWSSTFSSGNKMYVLFEYYTGTINAQLPLLAYYGSSVRCVARDGNEPETIHTSTFDEAYAAVGKSMDATSGKYKLHEMTPTICSAVTTGQTGQLVDVRDGIVYRVGKLADGRCWLLDNLALDLTANGASSNITTSNTNADQTSLDALFGISTRDISTNPDGNLSTAGVNTYWYDDYSSPSIHKTNRNQTNSNDTIQYIRNSKYGIYYNYCAASAGSYCYGTRIGNTHNSNSGYDRPNTIIDAEYDICPAGWRLPTGTSAGEFQTLYSAYKQNGSVFRTALLAPLAGRVSTGPSPDSEQSYGYMWSSTFFSRASMHTLSFSSRNAYPVSDANGEGFSRQAGASVRCIAK